MHCECRSTDSLLKMIATTCIMSQPLWDPDEVAFIEPILIDYVTPTERWFLRGFRYQLSVSQDLGNWDRGFVLEGTTRYDYFGPLPCKWCAGKMFMEDKNSREGEKYVTPRSAQWKRHQTLGCPSNEKPLPIDAAAGVVTAIPVPCSVNAGEEKAETKSLDLRRSIQTRTE